MPSPIEVVAQFASGTCPLRPEERGTERPLQNSFVARGSVEAARTLGGEFLCRQFKLIHSQNPTAESENRLESGWKQSRWVILPS